MSVHQGFFGMPLYEAMALYMKQHQQQVNAIYTRFVMFGEEVVSAMARG